ncbi:MAG: VTT domain-containing protein [Deltaproteobacteria bacterium]|nr:VTT domain-containing protein [Deltaproteobacteria bacterium]
MTEDLLSSFGLYGGAGISAFLFGLIPFNQDVVLFGMSATLVDSPSQLPLIVIIATIAHTIAKVITYYIGRGLLELPRGRFKSVIERARGKLDQWNKRPYWVMGLAALVGLPPLYIVGFIASALRIRIVPFILICFVGRLIHFGIVVAIPWITY